VEFNFVSEEVRLRVLLVTENPYLPQAVDGSQTIANDLCHGLLRRGHHVSVLAGFVRKGVLGWQLSIRRKISRASILADRKCGYSVWRSWSPQDSFEQVACKEAPDVVLALAPIRTALIAKDAGYPTVIHLTGPGTGGLDIVFHELLDGACVAISHFTSDWFERRFGRQVPVIYPVIPPEAYRTHTTRQNVMFINPVPPKGLDIALEVARRCRDIPFVFVEGWLLPSDRRLELARRLAMHQNVTFLERQLDMRRVYETCRVLLAPSIWEEGYGRVVTEAQISGIPAVASTRGGLPEAVGPGGILVDPDGPIDDWVAAVRQLWDNEGCYARLSAAATRYAARPDINFDGQLNAWEKILSRAACSR
jgi:glycosyltransferase involved in cell wall biosynthesis